MHSVVGKLLDLWPKRSTRTTWCLLDMQDTKPELDVQVQEQQREDGHQREGGATGNVSMMDSLLMEDVDFSSRTISQMQNQTPADLKAVQ